jgi:hypothetical protein
MRRCRNRGWQSFAFDPQNIAVAPERAAVLEGVSDRGRRASYSSTQSVLPAHVLPAHQDTHVKGHPTRLPSRVWRIYTRTEEAYKFASVDRPTRLRGMRSVSHEPRHYGNTAQAIGSHAVALEEPLEMR